MRPNPGRLCATFGPYESWLPDPIRAHSTRPVCNRPALHNGNCRQYDKKTAEVLAEWKPEQRQGVSRRRG